MVIGKRRLLSWMRTNLDPCRFLLLLHLYLSVSFVASFQLCPAAGERGNNFELFDL